MSKRKTTKKMRKKTISILLVASILFALIGCGRVVPPGKKVLLVKVDGSSELVEDGVFKAWGRDRAYFIDGKLKTYSQDLEILCADDINMDVRVKWLGTFAADNRYVTIIQDKVPATKVNDGDMSGFELSLDKFYEIAMKDIISSSARDVISPYVTDSIREQRGPIQKAVRERVLDRFSKLGYPIFTADIMITNIDYPLEVTFMRKRIKQAELKDEENAALAKANVEAARRDAELAMERGKAELVRAQAKAKANSVIAASLTPEILMLKQYEAMERLADGPNNSALIIPYDAMQTTWPQTASIQSALAKVSIRD